MPKKLLIKNAWILNPAADAATGFRGDILITGDRITEIGPNLEAAGQKVIDASGLVALPGFVQTHIHLCQTLFRNHANGLSLLDWLRRRIWPFEAAHTPDSLAASARLGLLELIKGGTTTILDFGSVYHTEAIIAEAIASGMRASVGVTLMDEGDAVPADLLRPARDSLACLDDLHEVAGGETSGRISLSLAPRFALCCTPETLRLSAEVAADQGLLLQTHASENQQEVAYIREHFSAGNVAYYHQLGMTGTNLCLAHCIWLDEAEIDILAETGTRVLHCPSANLKLGSGIADIPGYLERGIHCSLGSDGAPCNNNHSMLMEMRLAGLIQMPNHGPAAMPGHRLARLATTAGAEAMGLADQIGRIETGWKADIILMDLAMPHSAPGDNSYDQVTYAAQNENVRTVVIDGRVVMEDRRVLTIDEAETVAKADEACRGLMRRARTS